MQIGRAAAAFVLATAGLVSPVQAAQAEVSLAREFQVELVEGTLNSGFSGDMLVSPATRRAYIFFPRQDVTTLVRILSVDDFAVLAEREIAGHPWSEVGPLQVDTVGRRLVIPWRNFGPGAGGGKDLDEFLVLDEEAMLRGTQFETRFPVPLPFPYTHTLEGITITREESPRLITTMEQASPFALGNYTYPRGNIVISYDLSTGQPLHEPYIVQACGRAPIVANPTIRSRPMDSLVGQDGDLYIVCQAAPLTGQVVRLGMENRAPSGEEEAFRGPTWVGDSIADPIGQRLILKSNLASGGVSLWVFDAGRRAFTGEVGLTPQAPPDIGSGLDHISGRVYALTAKGSLDPGGLLLSDIRRFPPPPATAYTAFAQDSPMPLRIVPADGARPTLVISRFPLDGRTVRYRVLEDRSPRVPMPPPADPDRGTVDRPEKEGETSRNLLAQGSASGLRIFWNRGTEGLPYVGPYAANIGSPCQSAARLITFAHVPTVQLSHLTSGAVSATLSVDRNTEADAESPAARCEPPVVIGANTVPTPPLPPEIDQNISQDVSADLSSCSGEGTASNSLGDPFADTRSESSCGDEQAQGLSQFRIGPGPGTIRMLDARAEVIARRVDGRGAVVEARAEVRGIDIDGVGSIGRITASASSWANGRSEGAGSNASGDDGKATLDRSVCGISMGPFEIEECVEPQVFASIFRTVMRGDGEAVFFEPQTDLALGSPGGAIAAVQKDQLDQIQDVAFNGYDSFEVPGMRLIFYNDGGTRRRSIYDFAGVSTSSTYGIFELTRGGDRPPPPPGSPPPLEPVEFDLPPEQPPSDQGQVEIPPLVRTLPGLPRSIALAAPDLRLAIGWLVLLTPLVLADRRRRALRRTP